MDPFDTACALVIESEGGYVQDPDDPGGATKFGISQHAYPALDIARLTLDDAKAIYRRDYWDRNRCGEMPWRWALALFDGAVNQGDAAKLAQRALRLGEDGIVRAETIAALAAAGEESFLAFLALRAERYAGLHAFPRYGHGWLKRLFRIALAAEHPPA